LIAHPVMRIDRFGEFDMFDRAIPWRGKAEEFVLLGPLSRTQIDCL
jgi:hypothetical protein